MSITVADIMKLPVMIDSRVVAGHNGLSREVESLAMMEDRDSADYLLEHNFILTNGRVIASNATRITQIMKTLHNNNVSGIAIKIGRYLDEIPYILLSEANKYALPVIELPASITSAQLISSISYSILMSEALGFDTPYETDLIRSIITESDDWRNLKRKLTSVGVNVRCRMAAVLVKRLDNSTDSKILHIFANEGFVFPFELYGKYVTFIDLSGETSYSSIISERIDSLLQRLKKEYPESEWRLGAGRAYGNMLMLSLSYKEALSALCLGIATDSKNPAVAFHNLGIYTALLQNRNRREMNALLSRINLLLEQHDNEHNTELCNTLRAYAQCHASIPDTASTLFVHANTVRYRIDTIKRILADQFLPEEVGVNLDVICTFSRWADAYNAETATRN